MDTELRRAAAVDELEDGVAKGLGRKRPRLDAGAAQHEPALDDGDLEPELGALESGRPARRSGADHDEVEAHASLPLGPRWFGADTTGSTSEWIGPGLMIDAESREASTDLLDTIPEAA